MLPNITYFREIYIFLLNKHNILHFRSNPNIKCIQKYNRKKQEKRKTTINIFV